jgi:hypothetical protein
MLKHHGDTFGGFRNALSVDVNITFGNWDQPINAPKQRCFTAAGRPDDGDDLSLPKAKINILKDLQVAKVFADTAYFNSAQH